MQRVGGIIQVQKNGVLLQAKGNFTFRLSDSPKREAVMGQDGPHGYKETPQIGYIEGEITDDGTLSLTDVVGGTNDTYTLELATGKIIQATGAYYAGDGVGNSEEGNFQLRVEGTVVEVAA